MRCRLAQEQVTCNDDVARGAAALEQAVTKTKPGANEFNFLVSKQVNTSLRRDYVPGDGAWYRLHKSCRFMFSKPKEKKK